jgi:ribose 5-phosphate isomerase B
LTSLGHKVEILSKLTGDTCDYPIPAYAVGRAVAEHAAKKVAGGKEEAGAPRAPDKLGILICGTGIGMCIAANKIKGVRAAVVHDELSAEVSRTHNDANILCLSADLLGQRLIEKIAEVWLATPFQGGRHARRLEEISLIEDGHDPLSK